jgi:hypothetical protein
MKKIILLLLVSFSGFSQIKQSNTDLFLENKKVFWQHIYEVPAKNEDDLIKHFQKEVLTNLKQDNFQLLENVISFEINDDKVDFRKYGGTAMGTVLFATMDMNYLVVIDFKENKYRVTVKEIYLDNKVSGLGHSSGDLTEYITKKKSTAFTENSLATKGIIYFDKHFSEKFDISNKSTKTDNW